MEFLNKVILRGIVGRTHVTAIQNKTHISLSLVTERISTDASGNVLVETTWHNVTAFEGPGTPNLTSIAKGDRLEVGGRLRVRRYTDADGIERTVTEIFANRIAKVDDNM